MQQLVELLNNLQPKSLCSHFTDKEAKAQEY